VNAELMLFPRNAAQLELIMKTGLPPDACRTLPDAMEPGFHCVRTHSNRGFMTFQLVRRT